MKVEDLVKLNLDDLETELDKGSFSKAFLDSLLEAEKAAKDRSGAIELINDAIELEELEELEGEESEGEESEGEESEGEELEGEELEGEELEGEESELYAVAKGYSIGFRAGVKSEGEIIDTSWSDFKDNPKLLDSLIDRGLVIAV